MMLGHWWFHNHTWAPTSLQGSQGHPDFWQVDLRAAMGGRHAAGSRNLSRKKFAWNKAHLAVVFSGQGGRLDSSYRPTLHHRGSAPSRRSCCWLPLAGLCGLCNLGRLLRSWGHHQPLTSWDLDGLVCSVQANFFLAEPKAGRNPPSMTEEVFTCDAYVQHCDATAMLYACAAFTKPGALCRSFATSQAWWPINYHGPSTAMAHQLPWATNIKTLDFYIGGPSTTMTLVNHWSTQHLTHHKPLTFHTGPLIT